MGQGFHSDDNSTLQGSFSMQGDLDVTGDASFGGTVTHSAGYDRNQATWIAGWGVGNASPNQNSIGIDTLETLKHRSAGTADSTLEVFHYSQGHKFKINGTLQATLGVDFGSGLDVAKGIIAQEDIQAKGDFVSADGSAGITQSGNSKVAIVDDRGDAHELTFKNGLLVTYEIH
jgi:hypothetical protein